MVRGGSSGRSLVNRGDPGEEPWKGSLVMFWQMVQRKMCPVKSATPRVTVDLSERRNVSPQRQTSGGRRGCVCGQGSGRRASPGRTPVMHPGGSDGSCQAAPRGRALDGRHPRQGLELASYRKGCRPGKGVACHPRASWNASLSPGLPAGLPAVPATLLGAPLSPRRVSFRRGYHPLGTSWHPFNPSFHASLSVRPPSASGPALTAQR